MKSRLFLLAFLLCAFAPLREVSAAQLIRDGKLQTDLNANTNRITNATDVVTASGVSLTNLAANLGGGSGTLYRVESQVSGLGFTTPNGPTAFLTGTVATAGSFADTNSVGVISSNAVNQSTNVSARLASNVWATAGSTTNYALRRDGRATPIYGIGNVFSDGGHAAINTMNTRLDIHSTNKSFAVVGLYQIATNLNTDWPPGLDLWNYGSTVTGVIPENVRSAKIVLGVHTAEGTWGPQLYGIWGGASNDGFGMVTAFADSFGLPQERTRVTWQGLTVSGRVTAATGFTGDGASLTNIGIAALAQSVTTNIGARLASNVWAAADSTTNSVRRLGGNYYATNSWIFANQAGDTFVSIGADSNIVVAVDATHLFQFNAGGFTLFNTPFAGDGSGLTDIPLTALRITNIASAGQVLATSNGTNGYWTTVTGGGGSSDTNPILTQVTIADGVGGTNLIVVTNSASRLYFNRASNVVFFGFTGYPTNSAWAISVEVAPSATSFALDPAISNGLAVVFNATNTTLFQARKNRGESFVRVKQQ